MIITFQGLQKFQMSFRILHAVKVEYFSAGYFRKLSEMADKIQENLPSEDGWHVSPVSPMKIVDLFPSVWIREDFVLHAYVFRKGGNGSGIVYAIPEDEEFPEPDKCEFLNDVLRTPKPAGALDFRSVMDGDGSPLSYISASILTRELQEFGALWHGCRWKHHKIVGGRRKSWDEFEWLREIRNFRPRVISSESTAVEFFTYTEHTARSVWLNRDRYFSGYLFESEAEIVARGGVEYIV